MEKINKKRPWYLGSLGIFFSLLTLWLNFTAYFGYLTLFIGIIAVLFCWMGIKSSANKNVKYFNYVILAVSITACVLVIVGELKTKHTGKIEFIDEFSKEVDEKLDQSKGIRHTINLEIIRFIL